MVGVVYKAFYTAVLVILLVGNGNIASAQVANQPTMERPKLKVGDQWQYERKDGLSKVSQGREAVVVVAVSETIDVAQTPGAAAEIKWDLDGSFLSNRLTGRQSKYSGDGSFYAWPLAVGKNGNSRWTGLIPKAQKAKPPILPK